MGRNICGHGSRVYHHNWRTNGKFMIVIGLYTFKKPIFSTPCHFRRVLCRSGRRALVWWDIMMTTTAPLFPSASVRVCVSLSLHSTRTPYFSCRINCTPQPCSHLPIHSAQVWPSSDVDLGHHTSLPWDRSIYRETPPCYPGESRSSCDGGGRTKRINCKHEKLIYSRTVALRHSLISHNSPQKHPWRGW